MNADQSGFFIVVVIILFLVVIGLGIWVFFLLNRPRLMCPTGQSCREPCPKCPIRSENEGAPIYLYGFKPGPAARAVSSSSGVLTPMNGSIQLAPLNKITPQNQQWRFIPKGNNMLLQHVMSSRYLNNSSGTTLTLTDDSEQAFNFQLIGPKRDGRIYYLRSNDKYVNVDDNLMVDLLDATGATLPLNTEWMIALGTCQAQTGEAC